MGEFNGDSDLDAQVDEKADQLGEFAQGEGLSAPADQVAGESSVAPDAPADEAAADETVADGAPADDARDGETIDEDGRPIESDAPRTGDPVIDESLDALGAAPDSDLDAQIAAGENVHQTLRSRLSDLGG